MKHPLKTIAIAAALGCATLVVSAQPMGGQEGMMGAGRMGKMDSDHMDAMVARRAEALKAQLKLTPEQEPAWNAYVTAMKPDPKAAAQHPTREEMEKLSTPERIDKMRALRNEQHAAMNAAMDKRDQATKTFYNTLNADQKKVFDNQHMRMGEHMGRKGDKAKGQPPAKP